ncbi:hypothetical protein Ahy_B01g056546 isoform A [Arachis hypogaea]|uniref:Uncharacterized protein n=1 Tax=Arachis hypogaea TaxID=3818 RepID=A0A445AZ31_ARAHY|nr:hypothetical protein Ahy_B01g056546 isoform A [Arachis hypogaea]
MDMHKRRKNFMETNIKKSKELLKSMDHGHVSDISMKEVNKDLVTSFKEKLEAISSLKSIFKVPVKLLQTNQKVYIPTKVLEGKDFPSTAYCYFVTELNIRLVSFTGSMEVGR